MKRVKSIVPLLLAAVFTGQVLAQKPVLTYQDCVLQATGQGYIRNREDIGRIKQDCQARFPNSAPEVLGEKLKSDALDEIELYTNRGNSGDIRGSIYNGSPHIFLTRVTILLTPNRDDSVQDFFDSEEFSITMNIPPRKTKHFTIEAEQTDIDTVDFTSKLIRAWGY